MILDCFPYNGEIDILEIRLHEMAPRVDVFMISEMAQTFSGKPKKIHFHDDLVRVSDFKDQIIFISPPLADFDSPWDRQKYQRDYMFHCLTINDDDILIVGDVDEIVPRDIVPDRDNPPREMQVAIQKNHIYYLDRVRPGGWPGPVFLTFGELRARFGKSGYEARMARRKGNAIPGGGWHLSNTGGYSRVIKKLAASCHFDAPWTKRMEHDENLLRRKIRGEIPIKGRSLETIEVSPETLPPWLAENREKFNDLFWGES